MSKQPSRCAIRNDESRGELVRRASAEAAGAAAALEASEVEISKLQADLDDASNRVLRAQAELETTASASGANSKTSAAMPRCRLLGDLLPVLDNIQRAIAAAEKSHGGGSLLEGVKLVAQTLEAVLAQHDCKRIERWHKPFDPAFHQAISQQPSAEYPPGTVVLVAQDGYTLHDRVIRPAQVIVSESPDA